jgi:hypothetical protein
MQAFLLQRLIRIWKVGICSSPKAVVVEALEVVEVVEALEQARQGPVQAAPAWVLDQGLARVKGALDPVALKDRTALVLAMEPAMMVLVRQTVQALAQATALVRAGLVRAAVETNANPFTLLKGPLTPRLSLNMGQRAG